MGTKRTASFALALLALLHPLLTLAQQAAGPQPSQWDGPGPWHMWSGAWGFWWMFPLFMLFMIIVCVVIFFLGHRVGGGHHHWGPWQMMADHRGQGAHGAIQPIPRCRS